MLFSEYISTSNYSTLKNNFNALIPNFFDWIEANYFNRSLLYDQSMTTSFIRKAIVNNKPNLIRIEKIIAKWTNSDAFLADDNMGMISSASSTSTDGTNSENVVSYQGYNVDSDYSKNRSQNSINSTANTNSKSINKLDEVMKVTEGFIEGQYRYLESFLDDLFREVF